MIRKVGVCGMGLMGHGIAQVTAMAGFQVVGVEPSAQALQTAQKRINGSVENMLKKHVKKGKLTEDAAKKELEDIKKRIKFTSSIEDLKDVDLVVEAVAERMEVKLPLYKQLAKVTPPHAILASNTSSLKISELGEASDRADRTIGMHFFNPVQVMQLVELVSTPVTDPIAFDDAQAYIKKIGKTGIACKDTPGFVVNRLLVPYAAMSFQLYENGVASAEDIDKAVVLALGHPMGPLTLSDYVGLDTMLFILEGWVKKYPNEPNFFVPKSLKEKVDAGKLGRKTGEGFYKWDGDKIVGVAK